MINIPIIIQSTVTTNKIISLVLLLLKLPLLSPFLSFLLLFLLLFFLSVILAIAVCELLVVWGVVIGYQGKWIAFGEPAIFSGREGLFLVGRGSPKECRAIIGSKKSANPGK